MRRFNLLVFAGCDCFGKLTDLRVPGKIIGLNSWIKTYSDKMDLFCRRRKL